MKRGIVPILEDPYLVDRELSTSLSIDSQETSLFSTFTGLIHESANDHSKVESAMDYYNHKISPLIISKEAWLQALAMKIVYLDLFDELLPSHSKQWEIQNNVKISHFTESDAQEEFDSSYILSDHEYGDGGNEHLGLKVQLWTPKNQYSTKCNIIVFQGTNLRPSVIGIKKKIGSGLFLNMDQEGNKAFNLFTAKFDKWIQNTRTSGRKLIITGHSLGGSLTLRMHALAFQYDNSWAHSHVQSFIFNSPGVDSATASILDDVESNYHIINQGDFLPYWNTHPLRANTVLNKLIQRDRFGIHETIELHKYPGLVGYETKGFIPNFRRDHNKFMIHPKKVVTSNLPSLKLKNIDQALKKSQTKISACMRISKRSSACSFIENIYTKAKNDGSIYIYIQPELVNLRQFGKDTIMHRNAAYITGISTKIIKSRKGIQRLY